MGNEQINKDRVRNGIHVSHLVQSWNNECSAYLGPDPKNHMRSRGVIKSGNCYAHELGHSLGLNHAVNQGLNPATYEAGTYNYGYYDSTNNIGTTMSYDGLGCFFYSNPDRLCPTQAERDARESQGLFDSTMSDPDKWIDGTWGSIAAGTSQYDSARFMEERVLVYERMIPKTNYGVTVGTEYVSTMSLLPQFNGASANTFNLGVELDLPKGESYGKLNFGDERLFYGNLRTFIGATIYKTLFTINVDGAQLQSSSNTTYTIGEDRFVSEVGILDNDGNLVMVGKLSRPIRIADSSTASIELTIDF